MKLNRSWTSIGATLYPPSGSGGRRRKGKEGDSAGGPRPEREKLGAWPTLVFEAGYSESLDELHNDMNWWFRESYHQVKIVVLAKFDHPTILLEKWEEDSTRPGAMTTRLSSLTQLAPVLRQNITITRDAATNPPSYNVARGALVLSFRLVFDREPRPGEGDFIFNIPDLQEYASVVWAQVPNS
jgi:hypothetical protein